MHKTIAILDQKGGIGKTTTAVTLAFGLASDGFRTLLVDLDTQGKVADSLGLPHSDDLRRFCSVYYGELYMGEIYLFVILVSISYVASDRYTEVH